MITAVAPATRMVITIGAAAYDVAPLDPGPGEVRAWRLSKHDAADTTYDVARTAEGLVTCGCPHYQHRLRGLSASRCKHGDALVEFGLLA
jgi:hypothetical protein